MEISLTTLVLAVLAPLAVTILLLRRLSSQKSQAPGPRAVPIIGHLHLLSAAPIHKVFQSLSQTHGPIMSLRLGSVPVVVASSAAAAKEFLRTHDVTFASRPETAAGRIFVNYADVVFSPYNEQWKHLRKLVTQEIFTGRRIEMFRGKRMREVVTMCKSLADSGGKVADLRSKFRAVAFNQMTLMLMGKRCIDPENGESCEEGIQISSIIEKSVQVAGEPSFGDFFPWISFLDPVQARMKKLSKAQDEYFDLNIAEHIRTRGERSPPDFLDVMLNLREEGQLQTENIKGLMVNILNGGTDPSAVQLEWALAEMIKNPEFLAKAQEEIDSVVGKERMVVEGDIPKLKYLHACIKESFRLHPMAPLLIPHLSLEPCTVMGYHVPAKTMLFVNVYAIGRDPSLWEDPLEFRPQRFVDSDMDVKGLHFELLPFGSGRRICPGISLGLTTVGLTLANLVHGFDWKQAPGMEIDTVSEQFGLALSMGNKLQAIPVPRLPYELYLGTE